MYPLAEPEPAQPTNRNRLMTSVTEFHPEILGLIVLQLH